MATDEEIIEELRAHMVEHGWSGPKAAVQSQMWFDFLAPRIRGQVETRLRRPGGCDKCSGSELHEMLGHDQLGHKTANSLIIKDVASPEALKAKGLEWVLDFTGVGSMGVDRIQDRMDPDDYKTFKETRW